MKERRCTLLESFEAYKSSERFKSTKIHLDEYIKVLNSIDFYMDDTEIYKCLECFEVSSKDTLSYITFWEAVETSINPKTKMLLTIRNYKTEDEIYEYLSEQWEIYFPIGSLLKDHDYNDDGKIETYFLERILRKGAPRLTNGDLDYFINRLDLGDGTIDSKELLANINYYIRDRTKRQKLETRIPQKLLNPLDETEK